MAENQSKEEFIEEALAVFDGNFMAGEDEEARAKFRAHPDVKEFLERAYEIGGDRESVDICLEGMWDDMRHRGEI